MSTFTTPLQLEVVGKWKFKVVTPFEYHRFTYPNPDEEQIIKVPIGFINDIASIPRIFWPILSPFDEYAKAAVLHDWLYFTGMFPKVETEAIFKEAMEVLNVPKWKIFCLYWAVYLFGFFAWNKHRRKEKLYG
jgi:hypothetical protein